MVKSEIINTMLLLCVYIAPELLECGKVEYNSLSKHTNPQTHQDVESL